MKISILRQAAFTATLLTAGLAHAGTVEGDIASNITPLLNNVPIEKIIKSDRAGLYEVVTPRGIVYTDKAGSFVLFNGVMLDTKTKVNLTDKRMDEVVQFNFADLPLKDAIKIVKGDGRRVMVTFEDGWNTPNEVSQRYGVYTSNLRSVRPYPVDVLSGGHSGHVAAVGSRFVVFYSNDWINGGGVDNLGTGNGVYAKIYDGDGALVQAVDVAPRVREWWPMIAGSPTRALLVWQQYVAGETFARLKVATLDPATGALGGSRVIAPRLQYYTYAAAYVPSVDRFLVVATGGDGKGFAQLIDQNGETTATLACMPASVREAGIAVIGDRAFTPSQDGRLLHLRLTATSIELAGTQPSPIKWTYTGSIGLVRSPTQLHWVATSPKGLQEAEFDLDAVKPATAADRCETP